MTKISGSVFTTGKIGKILKVSPTTVSKWIDSGDLKGYKIPDSKDRRVLLEDFQAFLIKNKIPLEVMVINNIFSFKVLSIGLDQELDKLITKQCSEDYKFFYTSAFSSFSAGVLYNEIKPDCLLIDTAMGTIESRIIVETAKKDNPSIICLALADQGIDILTLKKWGFHDKISRDSTTTTILDTILSSFSKKNKKK